MKEEEEDLNDAPQKQTHERARVSWVTRESRQGKQKIKSTKIIISQDMPFSGRRPGFITIIVIVIVIIIRNDMYRNHFEAKTTIAWPPDIVLTSGWYSLSYSYYALCVIFAEERVASFPLMVLRTSQSSFGKGSQNENFSRDSDSDMLDGEKKRRRTEHRTILFLRCGIPVSCLSGQSVGLRFVLRTAGGQAGISDEKSENAY